MFLLREPSASAIESFLATQRQQPFSYPEVGASRGPTPAGYNVDHNRVLLGSGEEAFARAASAIRSWQMFDLGWCRLYPRGAPVEVGTTVAVLVRHFGFWSLNACRIVYLLEEQGVLRRCGFAYGTVAEHAEVGEERFSVEWDQGDGSVWYDLYAFSRPGHLMARAAYPLSRALQRRFAQGSKAAMVRAVTGGRT
ncbi:MAG TPA: DUF1990 domain-containing protein [Pyrinomonadaceae bacterium]|jgi:uncharacterized protein (UPF0548 family)